MVMVGFCLVSGEDNQYRYGHTLEEEAWNDLRAETRGRIRTSSPIVFSEWKKILLNPVHMFKLPTQDGVQINTGTLKQRGDLNLR